MAVFLTAGAAIVVDILETPTAVVEKRWAIDWGQATTPTAVIGDTDLVSAAPTVAGRLGIGATKLVMSQPAPATLQWKGTMVAVTGTNAAGISEAGVFDATAAGNMLIRGSFPGIALASGDSIEFTFTLAFS